MITSLDKILKHYPEVKGIHEACAAVPNMTKDQYDLLVRDIKANGLLEDLVLTANDFLLDGRHRLMACYETDNEPRFKVTVVDPWEYMISANVALRHLSVGQKAIIALALWDYYTKEAKKRMVAGGGDKKSPEARAESGTKTFTYPIDPGMARDNAGQAVGISGLSFYKVVVIKEHLPDLLDELKDNTISLQKAFTEADKIKKSKDAHPGKESDGEKAEKKAEEKKAEEKTTEKKLKTVETITPEGKIKRISKPKSVKFNKTNDSVDWAGWTWNPVTGCRHGCSFCYAREIAYSERMSKLYPFKFEPAFHEYRLEAPKNTIIPDGKNPRDKRVFVCSMADLFGKWVPIKWVHKVFDACLESPEWEYLFLTKWPTRYAKLPLLENVWYGATITKQSDVARVAKAMDLLNVGDGVVKWVSMEPMLESIVFDDLSWCDFMVIGGKTSTTQPGGYEGGFSPEFDWIVDVVNQCREFGVPYFLKANIGLKEPGMNLPKMVPYSRIEK